MWFETLDKQLCDAFRQLNATAMEQAAAMLSRLLRQAVVVEERGVLTAAQPPADAHPAESGLGIALGIAGELNGGMLLFFSPAGAEQLCARLLGQAAGGDFFAEPACSTLKEIGNIIASAYLASLDTQLQLRALPSPPQIFLAPLTELRSRQQLGSTPVVCSCLSAGEEADRLCGEIYLFPEIATLESLRKKLSAQPA